jgi:hypothetical protein
MSWAEKWIGIPYSEGHCLDFVVRVLRDEFGIDKKMPALHEHELLCANIFDSRDSYSRRLDEGESLTDGLVVLMRPGAAVMHVGLLVLDGPEPAVLHNMRSHGSSVLQPLRVMRRWMKVEGYYEAR